MAARIKLSDLGLTIEWLSDGAPFDKEAFVDRTTGAIHWRGDAVDEEVPEGLDDDTRYVGVPTKRDLDLGQRLVFDFIRATLPASYDEVRAMFGGRGAWRRFRDFLERKRKLDAWRDYERAAEERALREWAADNGFDVEP